jgi:hypothetical protein
MKAYQWLSLSAALALTVVEGVVFTSATRIVSPIEARAAVAAPEAGPATSLASKPTGRISPSKS